MKKIGFFSKKFKTRVHHFTECKYSVQWSNYRFIPIWNSLHFWFDQGHPGGTECWSTNLWDYKEAEKVASEIKNMNDLFKYYEKDKKKEKEWKVAEKIFWEKNAPYRVKIINK